MAAGCTSTSGREKRILKLALDGSGTSTSIPIDFMPDNIHAAPDGSLLIGGHVADIRTLMSCKRAECPVDWALARMDPATQRIEYLLWEKGTSEYEGVTARRNSATRCGPVDISRRPGRRREAADAAAQIDAALTSTSAPKWTLTLTHRGPLKPRALTARGSNSPRPPATPPR